MKGRNVEYKPSPRWSRVVMRIRLPNSGTVTALIYSSGKMICKGAKSEEKSQLAAEEFARIIRDLGYPRAHLSDFRITNIVASCELNFPIKLEALFLHCGRPRTSYNPHLFPGLTYRM
eukprot:Gb_21778 [translate_table: standard]